MLGHHLRTIPSPYTCVRTANCVISRPGALEPESLVPLVTTGNTIPLTPASNSSQVVIINTTRSPTDPTPQAARTGPSPVVHIPAITTAVTLTGPTGLRIHMTIPGSEFARYIVTTIPNSRVTYETVDGCVADSRASGESGTSNSVDEKKSLEAAVQSTSREHSRHASPVQSPPQASRSPQRRTCQRQRTPPLFSTVKRTIRGTLAAKKKKRKWCQKQVKTAKEWLQILIKKFRKTVPVQSPLPEPLSSSALAPAPNPTQSPTQSPALIPAPGPTPGLGSTSALVQAPEQASEHPPRNESIEN
ncbi:uncharacterized protein EAF01_008588 [Botrytis porri]|uniref:Uncharacterized protein n=1 Tax=Botrytis porri TaxID=87229 RepID=A0A4Z1L1F3_9HELO|nr:uncharacterized protein EAF01_008588 [Botrytis porri]KAF7899375.1 hypothetical protein EAF01_008588 [Botrytis porri]TGO90423.1 hypothetical protein BPOR_0065g00110 [Botrytis porri]